jgi:hypothetical protein
MGQTILNIYHVRVVSSQSQATDFTDNQILADQVSVDLKAGGRLNAFFNCIGANYFMSTVRAAKIFPNRSAYGEGSVGTNSLNPSAALTPNVAAVFTKRGTKGTRRAIGSMHIGPLASADMGGGSISALEQSAVLLFATEWMKSFTVPDNLVQYRPVIYNPGMVPPWDDILSISVKTTVRTMHRRTVGLGI